MPCESPVETDQGEQKVTKDGIASAAFQILRCATSQVIEKWRE